MKKTLLLLIGFVACIAATNSQNIVAGRNGALVTTSDGGNTWADKRPSSGSTMDILGLSKYSPNNWVITQFKGGNFIQRTTDGGANYSVLATNLSGTTWYVNEVTHFGADTLLLLSGSSPTGSTDGYSISNLTSATPQTPANGAGNRAPHFGLTKLNPKLSLVINNQASGYPTNSSSKISKYAPISVTAPAYCFTATTGVFEHNSISGVARIDANTLITTTFMNPSNFSKGIAYKSTDNGVIWSVLSLPTVPSGCYFNDVAISPNGQIVVIIGSKGYIARSGDAGATWSVITPTGTMTGTAWTFNKIAFADNNTVIVGGSDGATTTPLAWYAARSTDGGASFSTVTTFPSGNYTDLTTATAMERRGNYSSIYFVNSTTGYASFGRYDSAKKYEIVKTTDGGASWNTLTWDAGAKPNVNSAVVINHISNENDIIVNSLSGANIWEVNTSTLPIPVASVVSKYTAKDLRATYRKSAAELYAAEQVSSSTTGGIYKSADGGITWALQSGTTLNNLPLLCMTDGFVGGYLGRAYTTTDFSTFTRRPLLGHYGGSLIDLDAIYSTTSANTSSATVFAIGEMGGVFKSTNSGVTFNSIANLSWSGYNLTSVDFVDANNGYVCGYNSSNKGIILKTTDGGTTWTKTEFTNANKLNEISMFNANQGLAVGNGGTIIGTIDGGTTWISKSPAGLTDDLLRVVCDEAVAMNLPIAPTALSSSLVKANSATISWTGNDDGTIAYYEVYVNGNSVGTSITKSFNITGLTAGTTNSITVKAIDKSNAASTASSALSLTTNMLPSAPIGLIASNKLSTSFTLSWTSSVDLDGSVVLYEVFKDGISVGTSTTNTFNITGLSAGLTYSITVKAKDNLGDWSVESSPLPVTLTTTGIYDTNAENSIIKLVKGGIKLSAPGNVEVFSFNGLSVWKGTVNGETITLPTGNYIVKATINSGNDLRIEKILVK